MKPFERIALCCAALCMTAAIAIGCGGPKEPSGTASSPTPATSAPSPSESAAESAATVEVTDMLGRKLTLDAVPSRIVAIDAADCEIIYALGAGDRVVGRGEYCNYPQEALAVESVQSGQEINVEQIVALEPDLVVMSTMAQTDEQILSIEKAGVPVLATDAGNIDETYVCIETIGAALGEAEAADKLVADMKAGFQAIRDKVAAQETGKTVYFEVSPLEYGLWAAGNGTFMDEIAQILGLKNAFGDVSGWAEISQEQVIERNPDYIVTLTMYFGEGPLPEDEIASRAGWEGVAAVAQQHIYVANNDEIARPAPRLVDAARALYDFVYGQSDGASAQPAA